MKYTPAKLSVCLVAFVVGLLVFSSIPMKVSSEGTRADQIILVVGGQDKMKTRNPLPSIANDVWTSDVLYRIYDSIGQALPATEELVPYVIKGIDADDNGIFDADEYGVFAKEEGADPLTVLAYYDFNGIYFHDGVQADVSDLLFSYQLQAMNPRMNIDLRVLMDRAGKSGSNYSQTRWLFMTLAQKNWENEPTAGDPNLRVAVKFQLQEPFALFYRSTLTGYTLFPRHVWEDAGWRGDTTSTGCSLINPCQSGPIHADFGKAIYPDTDSRYGQGIPLTESTYTPYVYNKPETTAIDSAEEWQPTDNDVIGTGPFRFDSFDEQRNVMLVMKNTLFYTGKDLKTGETLDSYVESYIHQPYIDGIRFNVYASATLGILALQSGQIDFYHWSLAPEFVPELINNPNIRIWNRPEPGFFYLAYNLRRPAIGTHAWGQANQFDVGLHFRKAVAHLIDKPTIVRNFLQGYGVPGVVPVSPNNVRFYNATITGYDFSRIQALAEISLAHDDAVWLANNGGPSEAASWYTFDGNGKLIMPGIGTTEFDLWCPNADYDPVRANACTMIATEMNAVGINVKARPTAFSTIIQKINARDFDMYVLGWRIGGNDPDYLYSFFHSSNAAQGQNYVGFNDPTFDWIVEETRKELNEQTRVDLFQWAQGILSDQLPYDVLYFRTNIEAQRQDRFVGWMPSSGTIWNYWSLLNIKPPSNKRLSVGIEIPSAVASGDTKPVTITIKDQDGNYVSNANVTLELTPINSGDLTGCTWTEAGCEGQTLPNGQLLVSYIAPTTTDILNVTLTASVTYQDFPDAGKSSLVSIFPAGVDFLAVTMKLLDTDVVSAGGTLRFEVAVTTPTGLPKNDATVNATLDQLLDPPYGVSPSQGLALEMSEIMFKAPPSDQLPFDENPFTLTVEATYPTFFTGTSTLGLVVVKPYKTCPDGSRIPSDQECPSDGIPSLEVITTLAVLGSVAIIYAAVRKKKE